VRPTIASSSSSSSSSSIDLRQARERRMAAGLRPPRGHGDVLSYDTCRDLSL
jgi:hypothetical protein